MAAKRSASYTQMCDYYAHALQLLRMLEKKFRPGMTSGDVAALIREEFGCSRATSYRHAGGCIWALGLDVDETPGGRFERAELRDRKHAGRYASG